MTPADYGRLILLAAIWGAAFPFMRVAAPVLGAVWTAELRVLIGGLALLLWFRITGFDPGLRRHARAYFIVGTLAIALPFVLYAHAARHAPASLLAIVNASAPMFGLIWSALFGDERVTLRKVVGLALGAAGVTAVAQPDGMAADPDFGWAIASSLAACCAYGAAGVLIRRFARAVPALGMAAGNQLAAAAVLLPLLAFAPPAGTPDGLVIANVLALALLASGVAFVLYFRLIVDVGATRALTVTFLIPAFGLLWGIAFLGESLPAGALLGGALIVGGTALVTRT